MEMSKNVDELFAKLGNPGKYQLKTHFCLSISIILTFANNVAMVFYAAKTEHHCVLSANKSAQHWLPFVTKNGGKIWDSCRIYKNINRTETITCPNGWTYYLPGRENTIISEFGLVCDDGYKSDLSNTIYFAGIMISSLTAGYAADKYGRRRILLCSLFICGLLNLLLYLVAKSFIVFTIIRFLIGLLIQGLNATSFVLAIEMFLTKYRSYVATGMAMIASIGAIMYGVAAYFIQNWRNIHLLVTLIHFVQFFIILCFTSESLHWLLLKQKFETAEQVVKKITKFNQLPFPHVEFNRIKNLSCKNQATEQLDTGHSKNKDAKSSYKILFRSRILRNRLFCLSLLWFTTATAYFGLIFNISYLFGNKYLNFTISSLADLIIIFIIHWTVPRFGRRKILITSYSICTISNIIAMVTNLVNSDRQGVKILSTISALIGKSSALSTYSILYLFTAELFPTNVRAIAIGSVSFCTRFGGVVAPQIFLLGLYTSVSVPYSIIAALATACFMTIFLLPQTDRVSLTDTVSHTKEVLEIKTNPACSDDNIITMTEKET